MTRRVIIRSYVTEILIIILFLCVEAAVAQGPGVSRNRFVNPPASNSADNPVWTLGGQQVISWMTTLPIYDISIWQQSLTQELATHGTIVFGNLSHPP
jgi:hypothetical protein